MGLIAPPPIAFRLATPLYITIPENATKLITKNLKGRESSEDEDWHKPLYKYTAATVYVY